ncbi:UDP-N-acetylmuramoylalanine--D-glutamate ligase [Geoalkalibacter ferrihydriticus]|uniref:UDP-N-acetylmuramoylalanine--D-glutamate ligase n=2 Tax=Geoalkalibacter ferrihydriticus TaxID=392333 RepID=A0A0C2HYW6_9BACT|nr:UDP-N-acetylmuramoyl-L-alanine--D-glutamate ligase [Geoalkalibacter ferrihydriticus]KIH77947.1 UDP-N-acetylmuramoylalanine--D-glutamate ligase [Geoalkalibacter ferrihydriticus DSM 17813]SDM35811.1 UDP-N-acetylmuramoylalanine--D-glutamate ligase [Geoalkalibacter ferrihydriticus]
MKVYAGKNVVIVGAGRTGLALVGFFLRQGARLTVSDRREAERIAGIDKLSQAGIRLDLGGHSAEVMRQADLVAVSPGVPLDQPALAAAAAQGIPVLGEIEIAWRALRAPLAAVTGTNGKSTTTTLLGEIFHAWGKKTFVGGNLGLPLIEATRETDWDWLVAELSSFQLEAVVDFRPRFALLLNISEDHLDRYPDMDTYLGAKARIFARQTRTDVAVLNREDPLVLKAATDTLARKVFFSSARLLDEGMGFDGRHLVWRMDGHEERFAAADMQLRGLHNIENAMAALIPPLLAGCPAPVAWQAVCAFSGLPHRMVPVRCLDGVNWYNDSKATNVGSVVKSIAGLNAPVTLIAGGKDKGGDYAPLIPLVRERVAHLILIGEAAGRIAETLGDCTHTLHAADMEDAVHRARELTPSGGTVLLSPACSSFDMFRDFEERGEVFADLVAKLPEQTAKVV